ncbi:GNAT family N-acetyltransferase [Paracoccaceae bacterium GXU_MW_L88]
MSDVTLDFREITRDHLDDLFAIRLTDAQDKLIDPPVYTLAQAAYEDGIYLRGLWLGTRAIGLLAMIDPQRYLDPEDIDDPDAAYLWRISIDKEAQGQGHGRAAIAHCIEVAKGWGLPRLALGVHDKPESALGFYEKLGFQRTGAVDEDGEVAMVLTL